MPESKFEVTTLGKLGRKLPIGFIAGDKLDKTLGLVDFKLKHERALARIRAEGISGIRYAQYALALLVSRMGPHSFTEQQPATNELVVSQMYMPDVLYAFFMVRREALGKDFAFNVECPRCTTDGKPTLSPITADLDTLEVNLVTDPKQLEWTIELRDGVMIGGSNRKILKVQPPIWGQLDSEAQGSGIDAYQTLNILRASLVSVEGLETPPVLTDEDADEMSRYDVALIESSYEDNIPGPVMLLEAQCHKCRARINRPLNWLSPDFFSVASPSRMRSS
jgi:hypothetical protein